MIYCCTGCCFSHWFSLRIGFFLRILEFPFCWFAYFQLKQYCYFIYLCVYIYIYFYFFITFIKCSTLMLRLYVCGCVLRVCVCVSVLLVGVAVHFGVLITFFSYLVAAFFSLCKLSCTSLCSIYLLNFFLHICLLSFLCFWFVFNWEKILSERGWRKWGWVGWLLGWLVGGYVWGVVLCLTKLKNGGSSLFFLIVYILSLASFLSFCLGITVSSKPFFLHFHLKELSPLSTIFTLLFFSSTACLWSAATVGPKSQRTRFLIICLSCIWW